MALINRFSDEYGGMYDNGSEETEETEDLSVELGDEEVRNVLADLDALRDYLNSEVHPNCEYNIYTHLIDVVDSLERVFEKE